MEALINLESFWNVSLVKFVLIRFVTSAEECFLDCFELPKSLSFDWSKFET